MESRERRWGSVPLFEHGVVEAGPHARKAGPTPCHKVATLAEYRQAIANIKDSVLVLLKTKDGGSHFVVVRVK